MTHSLCRLLPLFLGLLLSAASCDQKNNGDSAGSSTPAESPFNADSAYLHLRTQVAFGPRVPGTESHRATADYLASVLAGCGLEVHRQEMTLTAYDGTQLPAVNLIASHNPESERRILLFAHWDTRPVADHDPDPATRHLPIDGADDGASGVSVLLELARLLRDHPLTHIGVDIALFDAEDYGVPQDSDFDGDREKTWALGTQYWTQHPKPENYKAELGILLDMVGAGGATFYREYYSQESAGRYVTKIWEKARDLGHGKYFRNESGGAVTDDHTFVIRALRIPCVDIINYDPSTDTGFGSYWHTHGDNLENISTETLGAVGATVWAVLEDLDKEYR